MAAVKAHPRTKPSMRNHGICLQIHEAAFRALLSRWLSWQTAAGQPGRGAMMFSTHADVVRKHN